MSRCLKINPQEPDVATVHTALEVLRAGGIVAYPTDTVYGLAVDVMNPEAIERLYSVKRRPATKALPVIIGALAQMSPLVMPPSPAAQRLMAAFWPGPLTLLMVPHASIPAGLLGGRSRIGIRWPRAVLSQQLALGLGRAITATSANLSGTPAALTASEVMACLASTIDLILDGGPVANPEVSTVLDVTVEPPRLCRTGKVKTPSIERVLEIPLGSTSR